MTSNHYSLELDTKAWVSGRGAPAGGARKIPSADNMGPVNNWWYNWHFSKQTRLESTGTSPGIWNWDFSLWTLDFFYRLTNDSGLPTRPLTITKTLKTFLSVQVQVQVSPMSGPGQGMSGPGQKYDIDWPFNICRSVFGGWVFTKTWDIFVCSWPAWEVLELWAWTGGGHMCLKWMLKP